MGLSSACADNSGLGPILKATCSRPGPASVPSASIDMLLPIHADGLVATVSAATARPMGRLGGFPTGRPWAYAFPSPFLGSQTTRSPVTRTLAARWARSVPDRKSLTSRRDKSLAATLTRIALPAAFFTPGISGGLVAGRRLSPCPHLLASHGLSLLESRSVCQERSPFSPSTFVPDDSRQYIHVASKISRISKIHGPDWTNLRNCLPQKVDRGAQFGG